MGIEMSMEDETKDELIGVDVLCILLILQIYAR